MIKMRTAFLALGICSLLITAAYPVSGQAIGPGASVDRVPLTVAIMPQLPFGNVETAIMRRVATEDGSAHDILLIRTDALDHFTLSAAIKEVLSVRQTQGDVAMTPRVLRVRSHGGPPGQALRALPWAQRVVNDLKAADVRAIDSLGEVRAVDIWLPRRGGR